MAKRTTAFEDNSGHLHKTKDECDLANAELSIMIALDRYNVSGQQVIKSLTTELVVEMAKVVKLRKKVEEAKL